MGARQAAGRPAEAEVRNVAGLKKLGIFVLILALLGCGTALLFWDIGADCLSVLRTGTGRAEYPYSGDFDRRGSYYR